MKPRLLTSKKWTPFPKDYVSQIQLAFAEAFPEHFKKAKLIIEGRIYPEEILLRVGYLENGRLQQNNFETSVNYSQAKQDAVASIHNCIDAAASMMHEFIQKEGEVDFPRSWKDYDFDGSMIWVQYTTDNTELESEADRLLGVANPDLVKEEPESEDALAVVDELIPSGEIDDLLDDENADLSKPSLFSGKKKKKKEEMH